MPGAPTSAGVKWLQSKNTLDFLHPYEKRTINIMRFHGISHSARAPLAAPSLLDDLHMSLCIALCECVANIANVIRLLATEGQLCRRGVDGTCNVCGAPRVGLVGAAIQRFCYTQVDTRRVEL